MRVSVVFGRLWPVKKGRCKLIGNRFVIPHDTIPSNVTGHFWRTKTQSINMKLFTNCSNCKTEISFSTWYSDRVEFKKSKGDNVKLTCKSCNKTDKYHINSIKAKKSKFALLIAFIIFLIGTPILLLFLWDYFLKVNYFYGMLGLLIPLTIPSVIYMVISKNESSRVRLFNNS